MASSIPRLTEEMYCWGNDAAHGFIFEDEAAAGFVGFESAVRRGRTGRGRGLADEATFCFADAADGFAVGDLGPADAAEDVEFASESVGDHFQVEFAHAGDDGLGGFVVEFDAEGGVFFDQFAQGDAQAVLVVGALGFDGDGDDGFGEGDFVPAGSGRLCCRGCRR